MELIIKLVAALGLAYGVVILVKFIVYVLSVIGLVRVIQKTGEPWWKAVIPFYNQYVLSQKVWHTKAFWITIALTVAESLMAENGTTSGFFYSLVGIGCFVMKALFAVKISRSFGKDILLAIVMLLFPFVGTAVLGYGNSTYLGNTTQEGEFF